MTETLASPPETSMVAQIAAMQDYDRYRDLAWEGSFEEYLAMVRDRPQVTRNAFQRMYDMVISYGTEEYIDNKKKLIRYNFFRDEIDVGDEEVAEDEREQAHHYPRDRRAEVAAHFLAGDRRDVAETASH